MGGQFLDPYNRKRVALVIEVVTTISLWELAKHASTWLVNLRRAKQARKQQSIEAMRKVITSARQTGIYLRYLREGAARSRQKEEELAILWTELSFELADLGLDKLALRCRLKGKHWESAELVGSRYFDKAELALKRLEMIADQVLSDTKH